jgi:hypothetical protein
VERAKHYSPPRALASSHLEPFLQPSQFAGDVVENASPVSQEPLLEMEADRPADGARRDVVRATESGEEVVEREVVGQVDYFHASTPLVTVTTEDVVIAHSEIKQIALLDSRWIFIVILFIRRWYFYER